MSNAIDYLVSSCGNFLWEIKTTDFVAKSDTGYFIDTSSGSVSATLPSTASIGDQIYFVDSTGSFSDANKVVILNNGHNIMGKFDVMEITEKYMSIYLVYADTTKGWVIADGKGCDEDPTGGEITVDTTIFLAPSASVYSPTGKVGSDTVGDGSINAPFYSIKRAIEYLENYRIKVGAYVTIQGLPGKYQYTYNDHAIKIKHKDAKYIKIKFDMYESGYYHQTTITTDTINITNNSDHDLIEFTVSDIGTGFYQIQTGDYIKIYTDNSNWNDSSKSVWNGYYKVTNVDNANKKVTIEFRRYQLSGSYNGNHSYLLPDTPTSNTDINVVKLSSHISLSGYNININNGNFINSEYGFGGIQMNISSTDNFTGTCIKIYDGILNDVVINANGFYITCEFKNLEYVLYDYNDSRYSCMFTSCDIPISVTQCTGSVSNISVNNSRIGYLSYGSILGMMSYIKALFVNNYHHGMVINNSSYIHIGSSYTQTDQMNLLYNDYGIYLLNSDAFGVGWNIHHNRTGAYLIYNSNMTFSGESDPSIVFSKIYNNSTGIFVDNSNVILTFCDIKYNTAYGVFTISNSLLTNASTTNSTYRTNISDNYYGLYMESSTCKLYKINVSNNTGMGCSFFDGCFVSISTSDLSNNSSIGVRFYNSQGIFNNTNIKDNGSYGILVYKNSKIYYATDDTAYDISNNTSYNIFCSIGSHMECYVKNAISSTGPNKNTTPSYSGYGGGSYILETTY